MNPSDPKPSDANEVHHAAPAPAQRNRRWLLGGGCAAVAAAAGAGTWFWQQKKAEQALLWSLEFETPDGGRLAMSALRAQPLVLNFWATWCPPCLREMPVLDRFAREFKAKGWQVLGLAADQAEPVREFLRRRPVSYPIGLTGFAGIELAQRLGNSSGGLPFTVVYGPGGELWQRHMGEVRFEQLTTWTRQSS